MRSRVRTGSARAVAVTLSAVSDLALRQAVSAPGQAVTLTSTTGAISGAPTTAADVTAQSLTATSATGINLDTDIATLTASVSGAGGIAVREATAITLTSVTAANGAISVEAAGTITATNVVSATDAEANDITLKATLGGIEIGTVNAGGTAGDVSLDAAAAITTAPGGRVTADALTAVAGSGATLVTTIHSADVQVAGTGAISITESDALRVTRLRTADGAISATAGGAISLAEGAVSAAAGASDVLLSAAGAITGPLTANAGADIIGAVVSLVTTGPGATLGTSLANPLEFLATTRLNAQTQNQTAFLQATPAAWRSAPRMSARATSTSRRSPAASPQPVRAMASPTSWRSTWISRSPVPPARSARAKQRRSISTASRSR